MIYRCFIAEEQRHSDSGREIWRYPRPNDSSTSSIEDRAAIQAGIATSLLFEQSLSQGMRDKTLELCAMWGRPIGLIDDAEVVPSHCSRLALLEDMQLWFDASHLSIALVSRESVPRASNVNCLCHLVVAHHDRLLGRLGVAFVSALVSTRRLSCYVLYEQKIDGPVVLGAGVPIDSRNTEAISTCHPATHLCGLNLLSTIIDGVMREHKASVADHSHLVRRRRWKSISFLTL